MNSSADLIAPGPPRWTLDIKMAFACFPLGLFIGFVVNPVVTLAQRMLRWRWQAPPVDLSGKVVIVTGCNTGVGKETAREFAKLGAKVIMACRSAAKVSAARAEIRREIPHAELVPMLVDLSDFSSVRAFAELFLMTYDRLDILVNNAGLFDNTVQDGYALSFKVNYMSHWLLVDLLSERIRACNTRIVNLGSVTHFWGKSDCWADSAINKFSFIDLGRNSYTDSKLATVYWTASLRQRGFSAVLADPGCCSTDIWRGLPMLDIVRHVIDLFALTPAQGASTSVVAATIPSPALCYCPYWTPDALPMLFACWGPYCGVWPTRTQMEPDMLEPLWDWTSAKIEEETSEMISPGSKSKLTAFVK